MSFIFLKYLFLFLYLKLSIAANLGLDIKPGFVSLHIGLKNAVNSFAYLALWSLRMNKLLLELVLTNNP